MCWFAFVCNVCGRFTNSHVLITDREKISKRPKVCSSEYYLASNTSDHWRTIETRLIILVIWDLVLYLDFDAYYPLQTGVPLGVFHISVVKHTVFTVFSCTKSLIYQNIMYVGSRWLWCDCTTICILLIGGNRDFIGLGRELRFIIWNFPWIIFEIGREPRILDIKSVGCYFLWASLHQVLPIWRKSTYPNKGYCI